MIYQLIEIEFFCFYSNILESIESCSIEKPFLPSCFEIKCEGFLWIQQTNCKDGKNLPCDINILCIYIAWHALY